MFPEVPLGTLLHADDERLKNVTFYHVSNRPNSTNSTLRSLDYRSRPHFELFRDPPDAEFLSDSSFRAYRRVEDTLEAVRKEACPSAPSRKTAPFAFICLACARWFREQSRRKGAVYLASPSEGSTVFVADLVWRNLASNVLLRDAWKASGFPFDCADAEHALRETAVAYWTGHRPTDYGLDSHPEALIDGELVLKDAVE